MSWLLADIGGTNTRCALFAPASGSHASTRFENQDFSGVAEVLERFLSGLDAERPTAAWLAVAAPIRSELVSLINIDWSFDRRSLAQALGLHTLELINDFGAIAHALPALAPEDLSQVGRGTADPDAVKAVLGPGTGLGVATLVPTPGGHRAITGEGGHISMGPHDEAEDRIIQFVRDRFGHCSAERLVSGMGMSLIHELLHGEPEIGPVALGARIDAGEPKATATLEQMFRFLGTAAADLALSVGAFGGIYIGGGIVPRFLDHFQRSGFRNRFENKGRYRDYLAAIPTSVITTPDPGLRGLAALAGQGVPAT